MSCMEDGSHAENTNRKESIVGDPVGVFVAQPRDEIAERDVDATALMQLIETAYTDMRGRLKAE